MENFDYDKMMVNFQGKEYPIKEITLEDGSVTLVSTEALDVALICDEDGMPISKEAEYIDNKIAYYFPEDELETLTNEEMIKEIYG